MKVTKTECYYSIIYNHVAIANSMRMCRLLTSFENAKHDIPTSKKSSPIIACVCSVSTSHTLT